MGTEVALFDGKGIAIPEHLREVGVDEMTKSLMGGSFVKRLSIRGKVFRMISGGQEVATSEEPALNVVFVAASPSTNRMYFKKVYKEGENAAPDCWSSDSRVPNENVKHKEAERCDICPQNIKGSGQGDSRACRFSRRMALVMEHDINGAVYQLVVPAASLFGDSDEGKMPLQLYAKTLATYKLPMNGVVTEVRFDKNASTPKLFFKAIRPLNAEEYQVVVQQGQTPDAQTAITLDIQPTEEVIAAEEKPAEAVAAVAAVVEKPVAPPIPKQPEASPKPDKAKAASPFKPAEPQKRTKESGVSLPPAKNSVAQILDEFED